MDKMALDARVWALKFDRDMLLRAAARYEKAGMQKSASEARKGAEALNKAIVNLVENGEQN